MSKKPIYVEIEMNADIDTVWRYTQEPQLHEQWDLRFTSITYNEKEAEASGNYVAEGHTIIDKLFEK